MKTGNQKLHLFQVHTNPNPFQASSTSAEPFELTAAAPSPPFHARPWPICPETSRRLDLTGSATQESSARIKRNVPREAKTTNDTDNDHKLSQLLRAKMYEPWSLPCLAKGSHLAETSCPCSDLVPLEMKRTCTCAGKRNVVHSLEKLPREQSLLFCWFVGFVALVIWERMSQAAADTGLGLGLGRWLPPPPLTKPQTSF